MIDKPESLDGLNRFLKWNLSISHRDGRLAITEGALWTLELQHPELFDREGERTWIHLDRPYEVVAQGDRAWCHLVPAPFRDRPKQAA
jgi:hypothetical protein